MAKQVLDLYTLYRLVMDKGSLVEVINKKIWREITKGLNLPTSITSAAFTLRTQYMKYLYPYECEKRALSLPGELQAAIDSKQREGWRQTFGTVFFNYSPTGTPTLLGSPKMPLPALSISTHSCGQMGQVHGVKKEDGMVPAVPGRIAILVGLASLAAAQAVAASQVAVLEQLREKVDTGEPPEKKVALTAEEQQQLMQQALQHNLLAMASQFPMNIKVSNQGVLFSRQPAAPPSTRWRGHPEPAEPHSHPKPTAAGPLAQPHSRQRHAIGAMIPEADRVPEGGGVGAARLAVGQGCAQRGLGDQGWHVVPSRAVAMQSQSPTGPFCPSPPGVGPLACMYPQNMPSVTPLNRSCGPGDPCTLQPL
ncbi:AT-rich interactive domain-containing protein 3A-like isoform X1 [Anas acuta]|uniref:AT-rich interactive domain-containing protein 3A-like isoform X1 n=1 Tax=Anas acuta TaxID=28680 RepID=UPI0035C8F204